MMMIEVLNYILGIVLCIGAFFFAYMSSHMVSEKKAGKQIPLPWEKKHEGKFDKQGTVKYKSGDNT